MRRMVFEPTIIGARDQSLQPLLGTLDKRVIYWFYYRFSVLAVTLVETGFRKGRPAANAFFFERLAHPAVFAFH